MVRAPTRAGVSPLWLACEQTKARMCEKGGVLDDALVEALVLAGADIDEFQHGKSPSEFLGYDLAAYRASVAGRPVSSVRAMLAQLGERLHGMQEVGGSIPPSSTKVPIVYYRVLRPHRLEA